MSGKDKPPAKKGRVLTREEKLLWEAVTEHDEKLPHVQFSWDDLEDFPDVVAVAEEAIIFTEESATTPDVTEPLRAWLEESNPSHAGSWQHLPMAPRQVGDVSGLNHRSAMRFKRGSMPIDARMDLHGMRQHEARNALESFILREAHAGSRCLLVITGKGGMAEDKGVLRRQLPRWLAEDPLHHHVLALAQAQVQHGGQGAFYILLRRQRG